MFDNKLINKWFGEWIKMPMNKYIQQELQEYYKQGIFAIQRKDYDHALKQITNIEEQGLFYATLKGKKRSTLLQAKEYHLTLKHCIDETLN